MNLKQFLYLDLQSYKIPENNLRYLTYVFFSIIQDVAQNCYSIKLNKLVFQK